MLKDVEDVRGCRVEDARGCRVEDVRECRRCDNPVKQILVSKLCSR